jgi:hypothetical protein
VKKLLIISPYFPPSNAADMQRIRMSLPYFKKFGWEPEVVFVDPIHSEMVKDELLNDSIPSEIKLHSVQAFSKRWTSKIKLGSIALRSLWFYKQKVNNILKTSHFDLIYFSTTQFPVAILGNYWKKKFRVPYVLDMQDPWHSDYYLDKPKSGQPAKFWFSYRLNKYLEPLVLKNVSGLISVSDAYISTLKNRYPEIANIPSSVITFGAFEDDFKIVRKFSSSLKPAFTRSENTLHLVYVGRGGKDMEKAIRLLFGAFKVGLDTNPSIFNKLRFHFIGTSYAPAGEGKPTIYPVAEEFDVQNFVDEQTDRIPFYQGLQTLLNADALFVPGSDDPHYTASKIYPYILAAKPLLAIFNPLSSITDVINRCNAGLVININEADEAKNSILKFLSNLASGDLTSLTINHENFREYSSENMTRQQCVLFDEVLK